MKIFLFIVFFNPTLGVHLEEGYEPREMGDINTCIERADYAQSYLQDYIDQQFVVGCMEAKSKEDVLQKLKKATNNG